MINSLTDGTPKKLLEVLHIFVFFYLQTLTELIITKLLLFVFGHPYLPIDTFHIVIVYPIIVALSSHFNLQVDTLFEVVFKSINTSFLYIVINMK